jgi:hypothetical protein
MGVLGPRQARAWREGGLMLLAGYGRAAGHPPIPQMLSWMLGDAVTAAGLANGVTAASSGRAERSGCRRRRGLGGPVRLIAVWRPVLLDMVFVLLVRDGGAPPAATVVPSGDGRRVMLPRRRP